MKNKKTLILSIVAIVALVCITVGISLAFFNYAQAGTTDNTLETGSITFLYTETSTVGRGIAIEDAFPVSNEEGKALTGEGNVFDFNISATKSMSKKIEYEVTARKNSNSTLDEDLVVMYLTKVNGIDEEELLLDKYNNLTQTEKTTNYTEKTLYTGLVDTTDTTYDQDYRLRMWITNDGTFTQEDMGKTFTITVNVYANASVVEASAKTKLSDAILDNNTLVTTAPTLTTTSEETNENGLYSSTDTNSGNPTYYFRGNVENNYVSFAGMSWRIVRINEDGTIRLILQDGINSNTKYKFNTAKDDYTNIYYTNSDTIKPTVDSWYQTNLSSYSAKIATGNYFCEQAKVKFSSSWTSESATMAVYTDYTPDFKCSTDGNGKGIVNSNIGLITYDEMVYAGGYYNKTNSAYYLNNGTYYWSMSPAGFSLGGARAWYVYSSGYIYNNIVSSTSAVRPVINLNADIAVTGTGTSTDPYVVE